MGASKLMSKMFAQRSDRLQVAERPQDHMHDDDVPYAIEWDANIKDVDPPGRIDERRAVLAITVEMANGRMELMTLREGDSAEEVATNFCRDHSLSDDYIFPLTEHILSNLQDISNFNETSAGHDAGSKVNEARPPQNQAYDHGEFSKSSVSQRHNQSYSVSETNQPKLCDHKLCSLRSLLDQETCKLKTRKPTRHHVLPSFASLAKAQRIEPIYEKKMEAQRSPQLSQKAKAVYLRLYVEFLRQKQRMEEEKRTCIEQYQERLERDKPSYTKRTRRIMLMRGRAAKQFKNYGELLYQEGLSKFAEKKKLAEKKHLDDQSHELIGVTAKPEISKFAKRLKQPDKKFWERLSTDSTKFHLRELRHECLEAKLMECTFRPQINRRIWGDQDACNNANRFDQLFWDAENRRRRQAEYLQWYPEGVTFRPIINKQWHSGNIYGQDRSQKGNVFSRLLQYAAKMAEKKQKWHDGEMKLVDPATGQELFRPQTGRKPYAERNTDSIPIGDFLYQLKFKIDSKRRSLADRNIQKVKDLANCQYVGNKSSQLLEKLKARSLQEVFDHLDSDKDGYIELNKVDMKQLSNEVVEDITDMRELGSALERRLSFEKFASLMMSVQKKKKRGPHLVLKPCRKHSEMEKFPFRFKVDHHSCHLASGRRKPGYDIMPSDHWSMYCVCDVYMRSQTGLKRNLDCMASWQYHCPNPNRISVKNTCSNSRHWYRLVLSERERKQAKIEALRKEKENQELAECTFRPLLHKKDCKYPARFIHGSPVSKHLSPQSTVVEREQQEIHGFIFQEVNLEGSVHAESSTTADAASPLSLLKSLKRIVSRSTDYQEEKALDKKVQNNGFYLSDVPEI